jgi:hypothetical protein
MPGQLQSALVEAPSPYPVRREPRDLGQTRPWIVDEVRAIELVLLPHGGQDVAMVLHVEEVAERTGSAV